MLLDCFVFGVFALILVFHFQTILHKTTQNTKRMFEYIEAKPKGKVAFDLVWDHFPPFNIAKPMALKAIMKKIAGSDKKYYNDFYTYKRGVI